MKIPYWEFFVDTGSHNRQEYFLTPPGEFTILDGKPMFARGNEIAVVSRKKIVLCDILMAIFLRSSRGLPYMEVFEKILDSGFELYLPLIGYTMPLKKSDLLILENLIEHLSMHI